MRLRLLCPGGGVRPHRDPEDIPLFNGVTFDVVGEFGVTINDLYTATRPRLAALQQPVNVHFTRKGSLFLSRQVVDAIHTAAGWTETFI
ncbi:MAG: hypothetical protein ACI9F9_003098 [Candidatus Paceibacteria bacterium]|jgi:hypothetical protein